MARAPRRERVPESGLTPARGLFTRESAGLEWLRARLKGRSVLVVDDEPDARDLLAVVLRHAGATVLLAGSAREGLEALDGFEPDVVVSDIAMPGEDGYSFVRKLRARGPEQGGNVPAIALTALTRTVDRARALEAGYQRHLAKPVELHELVAVISELASSGSVD